MCNFLRKFLWNFNLYVSHLHNAGLCFFIYKIWGGGERRDESERGKAKKRDGLRRSLRSSWIHDHIDPWTEVLVASLEFHWVSVRRKAFLIWKRHNLISTRCWAWGSLEVEDGGWVAKVAQAGGTAGACLPHTISTQHFLLYSLNFSVCLFVFREKGVKPGSRPAWNAKTLEILIRKFPWKELYHLPVSPWRWLRWALWRPWYSRLLPSSLWVPAEAKPHSSVVWGDLCSQHDLSVISLKSLQGHPLPQDEAQSTNSLMKPVWSCLIKINLPLWLRLPTPTCTRCSNPTGLERAKPWTFQLPGCQVHFSIFKLQDICLLLPSSQCV